ncbi:MAG: MBL fold metallo-hydrolase [Pseudomonadota bacterium]|nr:MBL fold metallo-hydrolase [Pseudomonadota bacterium]
MRIHFWGTRGSLPVATHGEAIRRRLRRALRLASGRSFASDADIERFIDQELDLPTRHGYGGNTSCVEIIAGSRERVICDMGSGLRELSQQVMERHGPGVPHDYVFFLSHVHWDHIMGFPFFMPAYIPGNTLRIHGCHRVLEAALRRQHRAPSFPVDFDQLGARIEFVYLDEQRTYDIAGLWVSAFRQPHSGDSYGFRFGKDGRSVVYSTDAEHKLQSPQATEAYVEFLRGADLVIFDAMYSLADMITIKEDWGHSSNTIGVDLCHRAGVKQLCMFHHEPAYDDDKIHTILQETRRYEEITRQSHPPLAVSSAYDGLEIEV